MRCSRGRAPIPDSPGSPERRSQANRRRALFAPDAGAEVGHGHVGRCIALAQALARLRWDCRFLVADDRAARYVRSMGFPTQRTFHGTWSLAVVDSYRLPVPLVSTLRATAGKVVAIDDLHQLSPAYVDWLIRPAIGERGRGRVLAGAEYVLLRAEYWHPRRATLRRAVRRALVVLGAYPDERVLSEATFALLESLPDASVEVVAGLGSRPRALTRAPRVRLRSAVTSLLPLLRRSDVVLTAGGQTMNEAIASGTPTLVLGTSPDQRWHLRGAARTGAAEVLGWSHRSGWRSELRIRAAALSASFAARSRLSLAAMGLVDGRGALRVARLIGE